MESTKGEVYVSCFGPFLLRLLQTLITGKLQVGDRWFQSPVGAMDEVPDSNGERKASNRQHDIGEHCGTYLQFPNMGMSFRMSRVQMLQSFFCPSPKWTPKFWNPMYESSSEYQTSIKACKDYGVYESTYEGRRLKHNTTIDISRVLAG